VQGYCDSLKEVLVEMDPRGMGRVPLSKFYADSLRRKQQNQSIRFTESEAYLRKLGALDETSSYLSSNHPKLLAVCLKLFHLDIALLAMLRQ